MKKEEKKIFTDKGLHHVSKNKEGNYVARFPFFYTYGKKTDDSKKFLLEKFPNANIINAGEVWKPFRGGASVANQSHWFVEFKLK